ncbi:MAG: hypothetical protein M3071_24380 [Actinomycetota bacterium]|nr:hypothetical protein [Actinomycetota bacterium]
MSWPLHNRYPTPRHGAAALAAAIAVAVGVVLLATSGGGRPRAKVTRTATATSATPPTPAADIFPHTPAGAVDAATTWCQTTGVAFFNGTWAGAVSALATPAYAPRAERAAERASVLVHRHLLATHTRYFVRTWPLGYAIEQYSSTIARVRVWQLAVLELSAPGEVLAYPTTTVSVQWTKGDWKVTDAPAGPELPPPGHAATAGQVASWMVSVDLLTNYAYAP